MKRFNNVTNYQRLFPGFETRSLPGFLAATHRGFTFYVENPIFSAPWFLISFSFLLPQ
jgi:hypothetical protein